MKFLFSLFILVSMTKECDKSKDSFATNPQENIEKVSEKNVFSKEYNDVTQIKQPFETYYIEFLKDENISELNLTVIFDKTPNRVSGFSGCNRFSGAYTIKDNSIAFSELITTKMYCEKTQETENLMLEFLSKTNSFSLDENTLTLRNGETDLMIAQKESIKKVSDDIIIQYSALSRGSYKMIQIANKIISVQKSRDAKTITKPCSDDEWNKIINLFETIDINSLSTLKAPTQARLYDGAAIANLKVIYKGIAYDVPPFDHGKPPKEIEALVKEILSIFENIE